MTATPVFPQTIKNGAVQIVLGDSTTILKTIYTAGANGSVISQINVGSSDSSARDLQFFISIDSAVAATNTLTSTGTNVSNGDTVTIGSKVYTFQTTLTNVDGNVKIGATAALSLTNLFNAINVISGQGVPGTDFATAMTANTQVVASNPSSTTLFVRAITAGTAGNSIASTESSAQLSWASGSTTLSGGTASSTIDYLLATVSCPANSGFTNSVSLLTILDNTRFGTQLTDAHGNKILYLASGSSLRVKALTAVTAAKAISIFCQAGDY